jgi:phage-related minor tail protein
MSKDYEIAFKLQAQMNPQFRKSFRDANRQLEGMENVLKILQRAKGPEKAVDEVQKSVHGFAKAREAAMSFRGALDTVAKFTGARMIVDGIINGFVEAIGLVGDFDKSFRQLQASTNITNKQMSEIKQQASSLYRDNIGENWDDLTRSMASVKQVTGLAGDALKVATRDAVVYRDVFGEDVTQSIRAADQMTKQFGVSQHEAFNLMAQGYKGGLNMSDELLDSVSEYSVYFKKLGYDANDMFNMFGAAGSSGVFQLDKVGKKALPTLNRGIKRGSCNANPNRRAA